MVSRMLWDREKAGWLVEYDKCFGKIPVHSFSLRTLPNAITYAFASPTSPGKTDTLCYPSMMPCL